MGATVGARSQDVLSRTDLSVPCARGLYYECGVRLLSSELVLRRVWLMPPRTLFTASVAYDMPPREAKDYLLLLEEQKCFMINYLS